MDHNSLLKRRKRFIYIVRFMYLVAFALIGSGFYINYQEEISNIGGQSVDTDYNNININAGNTDTDNGDNESEASTPDDQVPSSLYKNDIDELLSQLPNKAKQPFNELSDVLSVVDSVENTIDYEVERGKRSLLSIAREVFQTYKKEKDNKIDEEVNLDTNLIEILLKEYPKLKTLSAGQEIAFSFSNLGQINYLKFQQDIKNKFLYLREGDRFVEIRQQATSRSERDILTFKAGKNFDQTLINMGVSRSDAQAAEEILKWKMGRSIPADATVMMYAYFEFVGKVRYRDDPSNIRGLAVIYNGKTYYTIKARNSLWYDEKGFRSEPEISFERYPFKGYTPRITSGFNPHRRNPVTGRVSPHNGIDFGVTNGTPIVSPADGKVIRVSYQANGAGNYIVIQHGKIYSTVYMHLSKAIVSTGQSVSKGQLIAYSGSTGRSTGPHLHYEIHVNNVPRNPKTVDLPTLSVANLSNNHSFKLDRSTIIKYFDDEEKSLKGGKN